MGQRARRAGELMTYEELWLQERPRLEQWLRRQRVPRHDVEDIVDEAFARLKHTDARPGQLWQTALYVTQEWGRAQAKQLSAAEQVSILSGTAIPPIETAILRLDFDRAFRQLPREQQEAFALTELRGLTERETASVLGVSQKTINRRCEAARHYLREELR